ncbi:MAG: diguanylate cyclase domain-containing protein, partial [Longimicrobiales bacterium]
MAVDRPLRALVVDDDPGYRVLLQAVLARRSLEAEFAEHAEAGLGLFREEPQDILILDKNLPGISGLEMARRVRSMAAGRFPHILIITGDGGEEAVEEALASGVDDYLEKPIEPSTLGSRLAVAERRVRDTLLRRAMEADPDQNTLVDPLTGLATRALLQDRIKGGVYRTQREHSYVFAVLQLDLDAFRRVNEALGEERGNLVLIEAARRIEACIRSVDTAARITADEFGIFLDDLKDASDVTRVTNRIKQRFAQPIRIGDQETSRASKLVGAALCDHVDRHPRREFCNLGAAGAELLIGRPTFL